MGKDGNDAQGYHYDSEKWQFSFSGYLCGALSLYINAFLVRM